MERAGKVDIGGEMNGNTTRSEKEIIAAQTHGIATEMPEAENSGLLESGLGSSLDNSSHSSDWESQCCKCCHETLSCCGGKVVISCNPVKCTATFVYLFCFAALVAATIILRMTVFTNKLHDVAWFVATVFLLLTLPLSAYDIGQHLRHYINPELQRYVVRILWMVPIYAVESWFALIFRDAKLVLETLRESYEAYVIYCLLKLMLHSVASDPEKFDEIVNAKGEGTLHHMKPFCCLKDWGPQKFFHRVKQGALQYVVCQILCAALTIIFSSIIVVENHEVAGNETQIPSSPSPGGKCAEADADVPTLFCEGCFSRFDRAYIWIALIKNFSQLWAMYCLVLFYHAFMKELAHIRPLGKLLTVKAVVFFSFWQEVAISGMVRIGWIHSSSNPSPDNGCFSTTDVAKGMQDFVIIIEMFLAAIAHHYFFSHEDFRGNVEEGVRKPFLRAMVDSSLPFDVIHEAAHEFRPNVRFSSKSRKASTESKARDDGGAGSSGETSTSDAI